MNNQRIAEVKTNFMCQTIDMEHIGISLGFMCWQETETPSLTMCFFFFFPFSHLKVLKARVEFFSVGSEFTVFNAVGIPTKLSNGRSMLLPQLFTQFLRKAHVLQELRGKTDTKWSHTSSLIWTGCSVYNTEGFLSWHLQLSIFFIAVGVG